MMLTCAASLASRYLAGNGPTVIDDTQRPFPPIMACRNYPCLSIWMHIVEAENQRESSMLNRKQIFWHAKKVN
jgi:hypothetical protein